MFNFKRIPCTFCGAKCKPKNIHRIMIRTNDGDVMKNSCKECHDILTTMSLEQEKEDDVNYN